MGSLTFYYVAYVIIACFMTDGRFVSILSPLAHALNVVFTVCGLILYCYTIMMIRRAIKQCAEFRFETCGSYFICGMFIFILVLQIFYLLAFKWLLITIIIVSLMHFFSYLLIIIGIFVLLTKMG